MNSKSIGYVTDLYGKITKGAGLIVIANAKSNITDILQVVGLTQLMKTFASLDEAKNYLAGTSAAEALSEPQAAAPAATTPPEAPATPPPAAPEAEAETPAAEGDATPPTTQ